jgi:hypothetical protein
MDDNARAQATIARLEKDLADVRAANRAAMAEILDLHRLLRMQGWRAPRACRAWGRWARWCSGWCDDGRQNISNRGGAHDD